jgi:1-acyl-sn-glycerol-3-phosphate acyltransferase
VLLLLRLVEQPIWGRRRPVTPFITVLVCRMALVLLGLRLEVRGEVDRDAAALVANHSSWLDIFVLNAVRRVYFVSKAEVARWPGIGWLARATGTVFIQRDHRKAAAQTQVFKDRLAAGHELLFFPEGTSTDGQRVLPFKSSLFAAFIDPRLCEACRIQPVSLRYIAPSGQDERFFGWWGDMEFGSHFLQILAHGAGGRVCLCYHPPVRVAEQANRKALAQACETAVRAGLEEMSAAP